MTTHPTSASITSSSIQDTTEVRTPDRFCSKKEAVVVKNLVKRYPGFYLVIEELEIPHGVVGLLGESGSGKSTLLNTLAALDPDYSGDLEVCGKKLDKGRDLDELRRDHFSFLFQSSNLLMNFRVKDNVKLSRSIRASASNSGIKVHDVLAPLFPGDKDEEKMASLREKYASQLSGGQKQRVAVARALLKAKDGAQVLFADEPTANIDKLAANNCIKQLSDWAHLRSDNLLLFATHDLNIAKTKTEHLVFLGIVEGKARKELVDRVWKDGNCTGAEPRETDKVYKVVEQGSTPDTYETIQELLIPGSSSQGPGEDYGQRPSTGPGFSDAPEDPRPTNPPTRRSKRAGFLMRYFLRDIKRLREAFDNILRVATNTMLLVWLLFAASLYAGVPRIADRVFREDPLLRLVELRSLSNFPMDEEVLTELAALSLDPVTGDVVAGGEGQPLIGGVMPVRDFANRWYREDGTIQLKWVNGGRVTYGVETGEDPLFRFWGIEPLTRTDGIMVKEQVLADLGYDVEAFTARVEDPDEEAFLELDVYDRIKVRVDCVVEKFPDPALQLIVPAELAQRIKERRVVLSEANSPYLSFRGYPDMGSASKDRDVFAAVLAKGIPGVKGGFWLAAEKRPVKVLKGSSPEFQITVRPPDRQAGLANSYWERVVDAYHGIMGKNADGSVRGAHPHVFGSLPDHDSALDSSPLPRESNRATMFVTDYQHIPKIVDYVEGRRGNLLVEVSNKENKESIRTAQLSTRLGQLVIGLVTLALLVISTVSLTYSFMPQIHAKIGEIGILRAYGESRWFIVNRFLLEVALTCVAGFALAIALYSGVFLPWLNAFAVDRAPKLFASAAEGPLVVEPLGVVYSLVAFGCSLFFVGLVVLKKVRMSPSALLRMAD